MPTASSSRGFSLLEVMVSLAILALILVALSGISAGSIASSSYANQVTVATLLARGKMIDIEEELAKDGFGDDEKEFTGEFDEEGWPDYSYVAICRPIEVEIGQLIGNLFGGGGLDDENLPDQVGSYLEAFTGGGDPELSEAVQGSDFANLLGGGVLENIFKQVGETLKNGVREISLEITWKTGKKSTESVKFVQYVAVDRPAFKAGGAGGVAGAVPGLPAGGLPGLPGGIPGLGGKPLPGQRNANTAIPPVLPGGAPNPASRATPNVVRGAENIENLRQKDANFDGFLKRIGQ